MVQKLPTHGFLWKEAEEFTPEKINGLSKKGRRGYLLDVDVEDPKELHENELPLIVERMKGKVGKLVPNLKDKKGYIVHIKTMNQTLKHGFKLKKGTPGY